MHIILMSCMRIKFNLIAKKDAFCCGQTAAARILLDALKFNALIDLYAIYIVSL